jgi:TRAP transporter TAXI family solute receptor
MKLPLILVVLAAGLFVFCLRFVDPAPPRRIVMATGMSGGAYHELGLKYRDILAKSGITMELKQTSGTAENLQLLRDGKADVAFAQTGVGDPADDPGFRSLGSLGFEPLWIFYRGGKLEALRELKGKKIAVGDLQSGTHALAMRLLTDNDLADPALDSAESGEAAAAALREGRVDAAFFVASLNAPVIQSLLNDPNISLLDLDRIQAYSARYPYLSALSLPQGVVNLAQNLPVQEVHLVSSVMAMVSREEFHPALATLLMSAATEIHGRRAMFQDAGQFPSANYVHFPLSDDTRHYLSHGPSFLSRTLPFWVATAIERLSIIILPLLTLLIPLFKLAPPVYVWRVRRQIYRWYEKLVKLEVQRDAVIARGHCADGGEMKKIREQLLRLNGEVARVKVPLSYMDELYSLRGHIEMVMNAGCAMTAGVGPEAATVPAAAATLPPNRKAGARRGARRR